MQCNNKHETFTDMKTTSKYNKSQIMKRAWNIYKGNNPYSYSFSAYWAAGAAAYYNNARPGQYFGD